MGRAAALLAIAGLLLGAACSKKDEPAAGAGAPDRVAVQVGVNDATDKTVAVLAYLPASVKVKTGATVAWTIPGTEPHSVTFFPPGQTPPTPDKSAPFFKPTKVTGDFDGSVLANSGVGPLGPTGPVNFELKFAKVGTYSYVCVLHSGMKGTVDVVAADAETQAAIDARAKSEKEMYAAEGLAAKKALTEKAVKKTTNGDGSTTWEIEMGASTRHTDVLAYSPSPAGIKAGDSVTFINNSTAPHTASFGGDAVPKDPESKEAMTAAPGASPQTLKPTGYFNTGWLPPNAPPGNGPPAAARSFTFKVPDKGSYTYVCILHVPSGMAGTINAA